MTRKEQPRKDVLAAVVAVTAELAQVTDLDAVLDRVLLEARRLTRADAGSVFLVVDGGLVFSYTQNDTLFGGDASNKHLYDHFELAIDDRSIAGYAALTGEQVVVEDAYDLPPGVPYSFNRSFDRSSRYTTRSILAVPLKTSRGRVVGVVQVINSLDEEGRPVPFSDEHKLTVGYFASHAASAVERARLTREMVLRMIRMAELRDPEETGAHVNRVGAYSAEIYSRWATRRGLPPEEITKTRDLLRIAAMLHDVGKVAISDRILKKPGKLTDEEFAAMKLHTIHGFRLFAETSSELDLMSAEIALDHHERWNGRGYPGKGIDLWEHEPAMGPGKRGEEISIFGRIVALADVYDALISKRVYKEPWAEPKVLELIRAESGEHFDPELVEVFLGIYETIQAIREKYVAK
jgi:HD-GYP domain-containing protein (c-di-GMP phosphodiesterase class II)